MSLLFAKSGRNLGLVLLVALFRLPIGVGPAAADCDGPVSQRLAILLHKVETGLKQPDHEAVLALLEGFVRDYPQEKHYLIYSHLGNLYDAGKQARKALAAYGEALVLCPEKAWLWRNQAKIAWDLKDFTLAADSLLKAHALKPDHELLFSAVVACIHAERKDQALELLETLFAQARGVGKDVWLETYVSLGCERREFKRVAGSLEKWRPWLEGREIFWYMRAVLELQQQHYEAAAADLEILASFGPLPRPRKRLLADLLLQIKIPLRAAELYEDLLIETPTHQCLYEALITSYRLGLKPELALATVERALRQGGANPALLRSQGELYFELGRYEEAFAAFAELARLEPEDGNAYLKQGYCALRLEKKDLARKLLGRAAHCKSARKEARRLLRWLDHG
ncbi:MAG TPA: tetratricopeptide repeat protein [Proteobacteria bacterium]|nr:tetratricopeptide repeat protein [Pseudomonadota bacterium]